MFDWEFLFYSKSLQVDHNKPLLVAAGHDSLQQIGRDVLFYLLCSVKKS